MAAVSPYLNFNGNCDEAFEFYKTVFGVEPAAKMRFSDVPSEYSMGEADGKKIMHVSLPLGNGSFLMGSDMPPGMEVNVGNNFYVSLHTESQEESTRLFDALAEGGNVMMPLEKTFWAAAFGMLTDKFGINWMINLDDRAIG